MTRRKKKKKKKKKKKPLPPLRKRLKRPARLKAARRWLDTYKGRNVIRGYARWFGVDPRCAINELRMLKVELDPEYVESLKAELEPGRRRRKAVAPPVAFPPEDYGIEWDDHYAFIAGFTPGGFAYGVTWEEWEKLEQAEEEPAIAHEPPERI